MTNQGKPKASDRAYLEYWGLTDNGNQEVEVTKEQEAAIKVITDSLQEGTKEGAQSTGAGNPNTNRFVLDMGKRLTRVLLSLAFLSGMALVALIAWLSWPPNNVQPAPETPTMATAQVLTDIQRQVNNLTEQVIVAQRQVTELVWLFNDHTKEDTSNDY